jgi:sugar phosphate isomerase/epimerase
MNAEISINTLAYEGYDLRTATTEISKMGASYIEFGFTRDWMSSLTEELFEEVNAKRMSTLLSDVGLSCIALAAHMDLTMESSIIEFKKRMNYAKRIGARIIHTKVGPVSRKKAFMENVETLARMAEQMDILIGLENPAEGENEIIDSGKAGALIIKEIGSSFVKLNYDFGNTFAYSHGQVRPESDYRKALPHVAHLHLKDVRKNESGWYFSQIGKGVINYDAIIESLMKEKRLLPMSIELPFIFNLSHDFIVRRSEKPMELSQITKTLQDSLNYVKETIQKHSEKL